MKGEKRLDVDMNRVAHITNFSHSHLTQGNVVQPKAVNGGISAFNLCNSKLMVLHSLISA